MSLEDVKSTPGLGAKNGASDHCNGHCQNQGQAHGESQNEGQDWIVLERIASLSVEKFEPSDFTGRFTKLQSKKRCGIALRRGMWWQNLKLLCVCLFFFLKTTNFNDQNSSKSVIRMFCNIPGESECDCLLFEFLRMEDRLNIQLKKWSSAFQLECGCVWFLSTLGYENVPVFYYLFRPRVPLHVRRCKSSSLLRREN